LEIKDLVCELHDQKLSWQLTSVESSWANSHAIWLKISDVSETLLVGTDIILETSIIFNQLTWPLSQEEFINV
jgi:hypothetical protein